MNETKKAEALEWLKAGIIIILAVVVLRSFVFCSVKIKGNSMDPTFAHGELIIADRMTYRFTKPKTGDPIICRYTSSGKTENLIKRVIAVPGDEINIFLDGFDVIVTINGQELSEEYIKEPMQKIGQREYPIVLGEDEYFVMGDNRNASADSREQSIGNIDKTDIIGRVRLRLWPINRIGVFL